MPIMSCIVCCYSETKLIYNLAFSFSQMLGKYSKPYGFELKQHYIMFISCNVCKILVLRALL